MYRTSPGQNRCCTLGYYTGDILLGLPSRKLRHQRSLENIRSPTWSLYTFQWRPLDCRSLWRHPSGVIWVSDGLSSSCRRHAKSGNGSLVILPKYNCSTMRYAVQFCWRWSRPVTWGEQLRGHCRDHAEEKVQAHPIRCIDVRDECKLTLACKSEMLVVLYSSTTWPCQKVIA
jgi:hypothetical protein